MKRQHRLIPTRDSLLNTPSKQGTPTEATALDLLLHLTFAADAAREQIYRPIQDAAGLTEGKLLLLTTLKNAGGSMSVGMLARRLGVTDATTSIMVSRMLKDAHPLVERSVSELDRRAVMLRLTPKGEEILASVLPDHLSRICSFAQPLTQSEQLLLVGLLQKLLSHDT